MTFDLWLKPVPGASFWDEGWHICENMCEKEKQWCKLFFGNFRRLTCEPRRAETVEGVLLRSFISLHEVTGCGLSRRSCQQLHQSQVTIVPFPSFISCEFSVDVREALQVQRWLGDINVHQTDFVNKNCPHAPNLSLCAKIYLSISWKTTRHCFSQTMLYQLYHLT